MDALVTGLFGNTFVQALSWSFIHSIWQFSAIALIVFLIIRVFKINSPRFNYNILIAGLLLKVVTFIITFLYYFTQKGDMVLPSDISNDIIYKSADIVMVNEISMPVLSSFFDFVTHNHSLIVTFWIVGLILFTIKYFLSFGYLKYIGSDHNLIKNPYLTEALQNVKRKMDITQNIRIAESKFVTSPIISGIFKPIILFPVSLVNMLSYDETEAILIHELAHFIRKDLLINVFQNVVETIFYYHPAVWWVSSLAKAERENCCDDIAITYSTDRLLYVKTLIRIQELNFNPIPATALAFSNKNHFSNRIKRILNMAQTKNYLNGRVLAVVLILGTALVFSKHLNGKDGNKNTHLSKVFEINTESPLIISADTIPTRNESIRIQKKTDNQDVKITIENGEVTELILDGKKIDKDDYNQYQDIIEDVKPGQKRKMLFFNDEMDPQSFQFGFGNRRNLDSLLGELEMGKIMPFGFHSESLEEAMRKLEETMKSKNFNFNFQELEDLPFEFHKFKDMEGFQFDFKDFENPEMKELFENFGNKNFRFRFGPDEYDFAAPENEGLFENKNSGANINDILGEALNRDGFLIPDKENKVELTGKHLKINGEKQPSNIWQKYKRIVEESYGTELSKNSKLEFSIMGKEPKRKYKIF